MSIHAYLRRSLPLLLLAGLAATDAGALTITREFTGSWYDPSHPGHGFNFEVVGSGPNKVVLGYWYTYDGAGNPSWVIATGPVTGDSARLSASVANGGTFGNDFNPDDVQIVPWGTIDVSFSSCNRGTLRFDPFDPSLPSGSMPISRLTSLYNSQCSGGISDDSGGGSAGEIVQFMANTGVVPQAQGKLKFDQTASRSEFSAEAEDLPAGNYALVVAGVVRGTIRVASVPGGTNGELEFRSPVEPGKVLLDFDPRGQSVEIRQGTTTYLTATFGSADTPPPPPGDDDGGNDGGSGGSSSPPPFGNSEIEMSVEPAGSDGPELEARLRQRSDRVDFKVELEDLPTGAYELEVGGIHRGTINVRSVPGGTEGELEFRNPPEPGKIQLDFDPRGQPIDILSNGRIVIGGIFPNS